MTVRGRPVDPFGVLLAGASVVVFLLQGFQGRMTRDVAVYAYAGQQVADGVPPYENILNRAGPLAHLVPGASSSPAPGCGDWSGTRRATSAPSPSRPASW